jgi:hypothetical protein
MTAINGNGLRPGWVEYVNYSGEYEGRRVLATYSYEAQRYVMPGELVTIRDEFGYWRTKGAVTFLGRECAGNGYRYRQADGAIKIACWQVVRDVVPAQERSLDTLAAEVPHQLATGEVR